MLPISDSSILDKKIRQLDFSDEFKALSLKMGYTTLRQVIATDPAKLQNTEGFNFIWLAVEIPVQLTTQFRYKLTIGSGAN